MNENAKKKGYQFNDLQFILIELEAKGGKYEFKMRRRLFLIEN